MSVFPSSLPILKNGGNQCFRQPQQFSNEVTNPSSESCQGRPSVRHPSVPGDSTTAILKEPGNSYQQENLHHKVKYSNGILTLYAKAYPFVQCSTPSYLTHLNKDYHLIWTEYGAPCFRVVGQTLDRKSKLCPGVF